MLDSLPLYCIAGQHIWKAIVSLIYFWIVEEHHPERVFCQFGMKQLPSEFVDMSVDLHKISLQGKLEKVREVEHAVNILRWANRGQLRANAPTLDWDTTFLAAYMEWYRCMTK